MVQLYDLIKDKRYLREKLIRPKPLGQGATFATMVNRYDSIREKYLGFECNNVDCHNIVPSAAIDWWHSQLLTNTSQASATIGACYLALSETLLNPNTSWTDLPGEITTGQLGRALSSPVPAHVIGTNVTVEEKTWTANTNFSGIRVGALFNHATVGNGVADHVVLLDKVTGVTSGSQIRMVATLTFP